ncbi:hypothetical protein Tco_1215827 [Tanacetum coccineum]
MDSVICISNDTTAIEFDDNIETDHDTSEEFVNEAIISEPTVKKPVVKNSKAKASEAKPKAVRKNNGALVIKD